MRTASGRSSTPLRQQNIVQGGGGRHEGSRQNVVPVVTYSAVGMVPSVTGIVPREPGLLRYWVIAAFTTLAEPSALRMRLLCRTLDMAGTPIAMIAAMTARDGQGFDQSETGGGLLVIFHGLGAMIITTARPRLF